MNHLIHIVSLSRSIAVGNPGLAVNLDCHVILAVNLDCHVVSAVSLDCHVVFRMFRSTAELPLAVLVPVRRPPFL